MRRDRIYALFLAAITVIADQVLKWWALTALRPGGGHLGLPGPVDLTFHFNESNAFGLTPVVGHATRWFLIAANLTVAGFLIYTILSKRDRPLTIYGLALVMAGAVGNALDRLFLGAVVDFLDASKIGFPWIFNLADATLDLGIGLLLVSAFLSGRRVAT